jgi:hypothetical protein
MIAEDLEIERNRSRQELAVSLLPVTATATGANDRVRFPPKADIGVVAWAVRHPTKANG